MASYDETMTRVKLFGGVRSIHAALGGGKVADFLLWRDKKVSAAVLAGVAVVWFLFEVVEYNFITLLCHITMTGMLALFIWSKSVDIFKWTPPDITKFFPQQFSFYEIVSMLHFDFNPFLCTLHYVAYGYEPKLFFLTMISLWIISTIGNYISTLNLVFFGLLCLKTLLFLYQKYEEEVDHLASKMYTQMRSAYEKLEADILGKIPRAAVKDKVT